MRKKTNLANGVSYDERTGLLTRVLSNDNIISFLLGSYGNYITKKADPYIGFQRNTNVSFEENLFSGTMNVDGVLENIYLEVKEYDEKWGGYKVELITDYGNKEKLIKKHDIAMLKCLAKDYEKLIKDGRQKLFKSIA